MSFIFLVAAMIGGWWLFDLSAKEEQEASLLYGFCAVAWCAGCLAIAALK